MLPRSLYCETISFEQQHKDCIGVSSSVPVGGLALRVDGQQRHEAGDLQQEVHQQRRARVQREGAHGRHVRQRAQEEAHRLRRRRQEHGRAHLAQPAQNTRVKTFS